MHLVAPHRLAAGKLDAGRLYQRLVRGKLGFDVEQAEPSCLGRAALDAETVTDSAAQYLIAAADAENQAAPAEVAGDIHVPALGAQHREVRERRLGAGQHHQIGGAGQRGAARDERDRHVRFGGQRVEVVEVGDPRKHRHRHPDRVRRPIRALVRQAEGVLRRQAPGGREVWHHAERG